MTTRRLVMLSAALEVATGVAFIAPPNLVATVLLGSGLSEIDIIVIRGIGISLLALGVACWPVLFMPCSRSSWRIQQMSQFSGNGLARSTPARAHRNNLAGSSGELAVGLRKIEKHLAKEITRWAKTISHSASL
jgi:hypothetical protein